jgi:hypothetical protein
MQLTSLLILATASGALANQVSPLNKRQERIPCSELGQKTCGNVCIDITDTCCPDGSGGCNLGNYCVLGDNGEYGCCPIGEICVGDGGASTEFGTVTSTQTLPPPEEPTEEPTQEPEPEPEVPEEPPVETEEPEIPEVSIPPMPLPTPIPSNGTVPPATTTGEPPVVTDAAVINGLAMSNLIGGLIGAAVLLL